MAKLSPERRGYEPAHRARRKRITPIVEAGIVRCARCGRFIEPGTLVRAAPFSMA
jgi:hypothetical protein